MKYHYVQEIVRKKALQVEHKYSAQIPDNEIKKVTPTGRNLRDRLNFSVTTQPDVTLTTIGLSQNYLHVCLCYGAVHEPSRCFVTWIYYNIMNKNHSWIHKKEGQARPSMQPIRAYIKLIESFVDFINQTKIQNFLTGGII